MERQLDRFVALSGLWVVNTSCPEQKSPWLPDSKLCLALRCHVVGDILIISMSLHNSMLP